MKTTLRRERGRNQVIIYTWKSLVVIVILLNAVFSIETSRDGLDSNMEEKKEITHILVEYLHIRKKFNPTQPNFDSKSAFPLLNIDDVYKKMEYNKEDGLYYIDLADFDIHRNYNSYKSANHNEFKKALIKIGGIRCDFVDISRCPHVKSIEMLIRRMVIRMYLKINCLDWMMADELDEDAVKDNTECRLQDILSKTGWEKPTLLEVYFDRCHSKSIQSVLKCIGTCTVKKLVIESSLIHGVDLEGVNIIKGFYISLLDIASIKSITSLEVEELQSVESEANPINILSDSDILESSLHLDRITLKSLANAYRETEATNIRKVLRVKTLHLEYDPYTFQEIAQVPRSSWIWIEDLILHIEDHNKNKVYDKKLVMSDDLLDIFKKMGIQYLTTPSYKLGLSD
ncbi:hypothetical protein NEFER03_2242 [Nematocida sp. LUAm3]|nr:hypothetical protein NEFER03_2242 [Nematocida sp. LUAm3]KAI5176474.1 hypothetical protein NEFER02_2222 [Nematocida sp. LUAm2]KAI5179361.1 hypothetical protein NEFER01_2199 [Nematocida sp. LUAm1]